MHNLKKKFFRNLTIKRILNTGKLLKKKLPSKQNALVGSLKTICFLSPAVVFLGANLPIIYCKELSSNHTSVNDEVNKSKFIDKDKNGEDADEANKKNEEKTELEFPWREFFNMLLPYSHWLVGAIVVRKTI